MPPYSCPICPGFVTFVDPLLHLKEHHPEMITQNIIRFVGGPKNGQTMAVAEFHDSTQVLNMASGTVSIYERAAGNPVVTTNTIEERGVEIGVTTTITQTYLFRRSFGLVMEGEENKPPKVESEGGVGPVGTLETKVIRKQRDRPETDQPTASDENPGLTRNR